ncbi:TrfB-related DNA-binding protein [Chromobacterium vaccinii]|uniref:TrfB-related DNA-binding protein n=1 Tax=Chromobacterium vaccinii TaxID=1108595 RepID=UPI00345B49F2
MQSLLEPSLMLATDFDRVAPKTRMKARTLAIARAVLVDGKAVSVLAKESKLTNARIGQIRDQFFAAYLRCSMYPPDWVRATVCAPPEKLAEFLTEVERERLQFFSPKA